jgi:ATP-dependent Clp protease protease subunit
MNIIKSFLSLLLLATCSFVRSEELVELNSRNTITIRGPIQHESVGDFMMKTSQIDSKEIYIYISSPGGSVMEGMKIVDIIKSLEKSGRKVSCISDFSASMAFIILQSCPRRLATFSSVLMQHQMSLGLEGNIENVNTYLDFIRQIDVELNKLQADKIGMPEEQFKRKIENDWWIHGPDAKKNSVVDDIVLIKCHQELYGKYEILSVSTMFGPVKLKYTKCPLSRYPVEVEHEGDLKELNISQYFNYDEPIFQLNY